MTNLLLPPDSPVFGTTVIDDNGQLRVAGMLTRAEFDEIERLRNSRWFLVRNDGGEMGERAPCLRGKSDFDRGHMHDYFTIMCSERPWRGIERGLSIWIKTASDGLRKSVILDGMQRGLVDYEDHHPQTAKILKPASPDTLAWYSMLAGTLVPIKAKRARMLAEKIRDRRPPPLPVEIRELLAQPLSTLE